MAEAGSAAAEVWKEIPSDEGRLLAELRRLGLARLGCATKRGRPVLGCSGFSGNTACTAGDLTEI